LRRNFTEIQLIFEYYIHMANRFPVRPLVIIPTYNERDNVIRLIPEIVRGYDRLDVLVVDDGSPDGTADEILRLKESNWPRRLWLLSRPEKLGLGKAYVDGFQWGLSQHYDFLIQMDGDWSHHPKYLDRMIQCADQADFVIGSRYVSGGGTLNWGVGRRLLSRFGSFYSRSVLRVQIADFTGGFNGWGAAVLREIGLESVRSNGYSFQIELKYRAHKLGFKHIEYPIMFDERSAGRSKMSAAIALEAFWRVWQFRFAKGDSKPFSPPNP
jgi:dolichol-phosphate mannosyltransferase